MTFNRNQFFLLLFAIFVLPIYAYKLLWLFGSKQAMGEMRFIGHGNLGSALGISTYPVIRFIATKDTVYFNGNMNIEMKPGDLVPVRYQKNDPSDAKINTTLTLWGDTIAYSVFPILVLLVLYMHPEIIPKKSKVIFGRKNLISVVLFKKT